MEIVPFSLAKKLKEKGFRELCTHFYRNGTSTPQEMFCGLRSNTHHKWAFNSMEVKLKDTHKRIQVNMVDAPTISQVLKWLREEKKIHITIDLLPSGYYAMIYIGISKKNNDFNWKDFYDDLNIYETYELAVLAGIEYCLDNLI